MTMAAATIATSKSLLKIIGMAAALTVGSELSVLVGVSVKVSVEVWVEIEVSVAPSSAVGAELGVTNGVTEVPVAG
ncbi:hypothetical protein B0T21DRAFT_376392 [Apiosordaria backusii]|uniref:Uncharacterized protein n=1 Tax=Apiosordaria backusii TaxID=314023 RepID=A0AA40AAH4_9PEZI|nr:hypothetical protein B0T21DRAFT_376392 [Apiosordaria backusii]